MKNISLVLYNEKGYMSLVNAHVHENKCDLQEVLVVFNISPKR